MPRRVKADETVERRGYQSPRGVEISASDIPTVGGVARDQPISRRRVVDANPILTTKPDYE